MVNLDDDRNPNSDDNKDRGIADDDILGEEAGADGEEKEDSEDSDWELESDIEE